MMWNLFRSRRNRRAPKAKRAPRRRFVPLVEMFEKRELLTTSAFTPGDLVVTEAGILGSSPAAGVMPVSLVEYLPTGFQTSAQVTVALPSTVASSGNEAVNITTAKTESNLTLSQDGKFLVTSGYNDAVSSSGNNNAGNRVVGIIGGDPGLSGEINTTTAGSIYEGSGSDIRDAVMVNSTALYTGGAGTAATSADSGVRYLNGLGTQAVANSVLVSPSSPSTNIRIAGIGFDNNLYYSAASKVTPGIYSLGTLPITTQQTPTLEVTDPASGGSPGSFFLADMNGDGIVDNGDQLYFTDGDTVGASGGGLYRSTFNNGSWGTATLVMAVGPIFGLAGQVVNSTTVDLYTNSYTSPGNSGTITTNSALYSIVDVIGGSTTLATLALAPSGTGFRGVAFAPTRGTSNTTLTTSAGTTVFGVPVTFTATVSATGATGVVTFDDGSTSIGTGTVSAGIATFSTSTLATGSHTITGTYSGDTNYSASSSNSLTQTVTNVTTTTVMSGPNPSTVNGTVTLSASINSPVATGTVTFDDNGSSIGMGTVSGGAASFSTTTLSKGSHTINAVYSGDTNLLGSTSASITQIVSSGSATTTLTSSPNPSQFGKAANFTATVNGNSGTPTGSVAFAEGSTTYGIGTLSAGGVATFSTSILAVGSHTISAVYEGDSTYAPGASATATQAVTKTTSTTTLTSAGTTATFGTAVTFTATVTGDPPTGTVTFENGAASIGTATLDNTGTATFTTAALPAGMDTISAIYGGDSNYTSSPNSDSLTQSVSQASSTLVLTSSAPNGASTTVGVTFTATVTSPGGSFASGSVTFEDGSTSIGTGMVSGGLATFATSTLSVTASPHTISALYNGDSNFSPSTSNSLTQWVTKPFLPGDLIAVQIGDGTIPSTDVATVVAYLDEFAPDGTLVQTVPLPTVASGSLNPLSMNTNSSSEGTLTRSYDGLSLGLMGFNAAPSPSTMDETDPLTSPVPREIGVVGVNPYGPNGINDSTYGQFYVGDDPRGAVMYNSTTIYTAGNKAPGGVRYFNGLGNSPTIGTQVNTTSQSTDVNTRSAEIGFDGRLYYSDGKNTNPGPGIYTMTDPLPTGLETATLIASTSASPGEFFLADMNGDGVLDAGDRLYVADQLTGLLQFTYQADGSWTLTNTFVPPGTNTALHGVVGTVVNSTTVDIYATSYNDPSTPSNLYSFVDDGSGSDSSWTQLATISDTTGEGFRGLAFAPKSAPSITLSGAPASVAFGSSVSFTASVNGSNPQVAPTGVVTFDENGASLGTGTISGGMATFSTMGLSGGTLSITAVYSGDNAYLGITSAPLTEMVSRIASTSSLTSSRASVTFNSPVTFMANVSGAFSTPTGTVTFRDNGSSIGVGTLSSGMATFTTSTLTLGTHSITAVYGSDVNFSSSTSNTLIETIIPGVTTTTTLTSAPNPSTFHGSVTFSATVSGMGGTPTGSVTFEDSGAVIGSATLNSGIASFSTTSLVGGSHTITAAYNGDTTFGGSVSGSVTQLVKPAASTTTLTTSAATVALGSTVTFSATVNGTGATPTGTVTFDEGLTSIGSGTLSGGLATFSTSTLSGGNNPISATYAGDTNFTGSTSSTITETVTAAASTTTLPAWLNPALPGQSVSITATVTGPGPGPTGTVTFTDGGFSIGSATINAGAAVFATSTLTGGMHTIVAVYRGSANYSASTAAAVFQSIEEPFTPGDYVVTQTGNPGGITSGGAPVFLDEYTTAGTLVQIVAVPSASQPAGAAQDGLVESATAATEDGNLNLSSDGKYLVLVGYNAGPGGTTAGSNRVIGLVAQDPTAPDGIDTSTYGANIDSANQIRSAVLYENAGTTAIYTAGQGNGASATDGAVQYIAGLGTTAVANAIQVTPSSGSSNPGNNVRGITIGFDDNIYYTTAKATPAGIYTLGQAPVTSQVGSATLVLADPGAGSPGDIVLVNMAGTNTLANGDLLYFTDNSSGIYRSTYSSGAWGAPTQIATVANLYGLTDVVSNGTVTLFGTTFNGPNTTSTINSALLTFVDVGGDSGTATMATVAVAPTSAGFRGVAFDQVARATATTSLTSSPASSTRGQAVTFTATLTSDPPTGVVTFEDDGVSLAQGSISGGVATFSTTSLTLGSNTITAVYSGDANFSGNTSNTLVQVVTAPTSTISLTASAATITFGSPVTFTATVTSSGTLATGTVTFDEGASSIGTGTIGAAGVATFSTTGISVGNQTISAVYQGDSNFAGSISNSLVETVTSTGLSVTGLTGDITGFTLAFNTPVSTSQLFLYSALPSQVSQRSVSLIDPNGHNVRGSMLVNGTVITYLLTGQTGALPNLSYDQGTLPTGTYTVILQSGGSDGFTDMSGNPLNNGSNYTTTFSITAPGVELSLPDFARGPGQTINLASDVNVGNNPPANDAGTGIPIRFYNPTSTPQAVSTLTFQIPYNPNLLTITGFAAGNDASGGTISLDTSTAGLALVGFTANPSSIPTAASGGLNLIDLLASVPTGAPYDAKELLDLQNISLNGGVTPVGDDNAIQTVTYLGDSNDGPGSGNPAASSTYNGPAATTILNLTVGQVGGFAGTPLVDPFIVGDILGVGSVGGTDATIVLEASVGQNLTTMPPIPGNGFTVNNTPGPDPTLSIPQFSAASGATVLVPVELDKSDELDSVKLVLSYDTSRLQLVSGTNVQADVLPGSLTQDFTFHTDINPKSGTLVVEAMSGSPLSGAGSGSVAVLAFQVKANAPAGAAFVDLNGWTALGGENAQGVRVNLELSPAPGTAAGDADNGQVTVLSSVAPLVKPPVKPINVVKVSTVTSVLIVTPPLGLSGADLISILSPRIVTSKVTVAPPTIPVGSGGMIGTSAAGLLPVERQNNGAAATPLLLAPALEQRSGSDPWVHISVGDLNWTAASGWEPPDWE